MKSILLILLMACCLNGFSQRDMSRHVSFAITNHVPAMPFSSFGVSNFHPGFDVSYQKDMVQRKQHEWFLRVSLGYFYHRFVQHAIPVSVNVGYSRGLATGFSGEISLGAGYIHSIPATAQLKLNDNGEYENAKGIGRPQFSANLGLGFNYLLAMKTERPVTVFTRYTQQIQMPFNKTYVPLLPYTSLALGAGIPLNKK